MIQKQNGLQKPLLLSLAGTGITILVTTFLSKETVKVVTDMLYILVTGIFVITTSMLVLRFRNAGSHGKAWIFFLGTAISWFLAEFIWTELELVYKINPFPSIADVFYLSGYPFLFCFLTYYIKPVKRAVTKNMVATAVSISVGLTIPSVYLSYSPDSSITLLENILSVAYPISDAIVFIPALIGIALFFRGEVNFTWSLICTGIFCLTVGDMGFQFSQFTNSYYTGHPADIVLMWAYILFTFGVYDHLRIFKKDKSVKDANERVLDSRH